MSFVERLRALGWFLLAAGWFLFADLISLRAATGFAANGYSDWVEPLYRVFVLFLLVLGYWAMSRLGQRRMPTAPATGLDARPGWFREFGLGAAVGWAGVVACILPAALIGGLVVTFFTNGHQFVVLVLDIVALLAGTLGIEIAFRGYPFLRLIEAMGPVFGTFFMAVIFAIWRTHTGETTTASILVSFFLGWVLALGVLRTRALWVSWGVHFAWLASMSLLFGLPASGTMSYSPVVATNALGPGWITGNQQGPEGSLFGVLISFLLLFAIARATADLKHRYGHPVIIPGGIPVDIDAAARRQHEAAMASAAPPEPQLVQILPAQPVFHRGAQPVGPVNSTVEAYPDEFLPASSGNLVVPIHTVDANGTGPDHDIVTPAESRPEAVEPPDEPNRT